MRAPRLQKIEVTARRVATAARGKPGLLSRRGVISWIVMPGASAFWFNDAWYEYTGATPDQMADWAWQDYVPDKDVPRVASGFYSALDKGIAWHDIYPIKSASGAYHDFLVTCTPLPGEEPGKGVRCWLGTMVDVTEHIGMLSIMSRAASWIS
jgi:hypothetical protein